MKNIKLFEQFELNESDDRSLLQKIKDQTINPIKDKMTPWKRKGGLLSHNKNLQNNKSRMRNLKQISLLKKIKEIYDNEELNPRYKELINIKQINYEISSLEEACEILLRKPKY
jgi:hypothetical protein